MRKIVLILVVMIALMATGCRGTKVVTVDAPRIEKEYISSTDTIHQYDSVWVFNDRYVNYDTVYNTQISEKFRYIYKTRTDTLLKTDTVTIVDSKRIEALVDENDALKATMFFYRYLCLCLVVIIGLIGVYNFFKR